jgi:hypothetical protein
MPPAASLYMQQSPPDMLQPHRQPPSHHYREQQPQHQHHHQSSHQPYDAHDYMPWQNMSSAVPASGYIEPPTLPSSRLPPSSVPDASAATTPHAAPTPKSEEGGAPDGKLLGFAPSAPSLSVVDDSGRLAAVEVSAELYGMFFVAEHVFAEEGVGEATSALSRQELTCYRRNLWQVTGEITVPRQVTHVSSHGHALPVIELAAAIHATESIEGKPAEIITTPWKSVAGSSIQSMAPHQVTLDVKSAGGGGGVGREVDGGSRVCLPVTWKRLQFKHATANNGRRKGMQQRYHVHISLLARVPSGEWISVSDVRSGPIVVRGRSPRNFDIRGEVPLGAASLTDRHGTAKRPASPDRSGSSVVAAAAPPSAAAEDVERRHNPAPGAPRSNKRCAEDADASPGAKRPRSRLSSPQPPPPRAAIPVPSTMTLDIFGDTPTGAGDDDDDDASVASGDSNQQSPASDHDTPLSDKSYAVASSSSSSHRHPRSPSSENDDDCLYEYFPLGVDDW